MDKEQLLSYLFREHPIKKVLPDLEKTDLKVRFENTDDGFERVILIGIDNVFYELINDCDVVYEITDTELLEKDTMGHKIKRFKLYGKSNIDINKPTTEIVKELIQKSVYQSKAEYVENIEMYEISNIEESILIFLSKTEYEQIK
jgi:hypothetical protein